MTVYIAGPDGTPLGFASEDEAKAYRHAQCEAEPAWLKSLRKYRDEIHRLRWEAKYAVDHPRACNRAEVLAAIERGLNSLNHAMSDDIQAAKRDVAASK